MPLAGDWKVFSTQVDREPFGIGSGVPKLQPVLLQSGSVLLRAGAVLNALMLQAEPEQLRSNWLCEPSGVGPSGTSELPPPMLSPPQVRFFTTVLLAFIAVPHTPPGARLAKSRVVGCGVVVVVVVDVVVVVVGAAVVVVVLGAVVVVVTVVVVVGGEVVVLPQGFGEHVPGPAFEPPALAHCVAVSTTQVKAPPGEPGTQHWIGASVVVVVVAAPVVVVLAPVVVVVVLAALVLVVLAVVVVVVAVVLVVVVVVVTVQVGLPKAMCQSAAKS